MSLNISRRTQGLFGLLIGCVILFGGLLLWQTHSFRTMTEAVSTRPFGPFVLEGRFLDKGILHGGLELRLGFPGEQGMEEAFLTLKGSFRPGLSPSLKLHAVPPDKAEADVFFEAEPEVRIDFSMGMTLLKADIRWNKATTDRDTLGEGAITACLEPAADSVARIRVKGRLAPSESRLDSGGFLSLGEKNFSYAYEPAPRRMELSYESGGDILQDAPPLFLSGPLRFSLSAVASGEGKRQENQASLDLNARNLTLPGEDMPPVDIRFSGTLASPPSFWLPCALSQLLFSSSWSMIPGICPSGCGNGETFHALQQGPVHGSVNECVLAWRGTSLTLNGTFHNEKSFLAEGNVRAVFPRGSSENMDAADLLTQQLRTTFEEMTAEGAARRLSVGEYETRIRATVTSEGVLELTGDGVDL